MRKFVLVFLIALLIVVGIKIAVDKINTEKIDNYSTGGDHLYHMSVIIKEIDNEQKEITTEVISGSNFLDTGEQLIIDTYNQTYEKGDELIVYFFPYHLEITDGAAKLTIDDYTEINVIKRNG